MKIAKLIMVTEGNNNKYYNMEENGGNFIVKFGRIGASEQISTYPISQWDKKYNEKIKKGYVDVTEMSVVSQKKTIGISYPSNKEVERLLKFLGDCSRQGVLVNFNVENIEGISIKKVEELEKCLNNLYGILDEDLESQNKELLKLYTIIPRKMKNVKNHLWKSDLSKDEKSSILEKEKDILDSLKTQVEMSQKMESKSEEGGDVNILDILNLDNFEMVEDNTKIDVVKSLMDKYEKFSNRLYNVFEIKHKKTWKDYEEFKSKLSKTSEYLLWHGSRAENWMSIIQNGLLLNPDAKIAGKMFGHGIYFADKLKKSIGYTDGGYWSGGKNCGKIYLAIFEVNLGRFETIQKHQSFCYDLNFKNIQKRGFESLWAKGGIDLVNDEMIIYNQEQCRIKYLIEMKS